MDLHLNFAYQFDGFGPEIPAFWHTTIFLCEWPRGKRSFDSVHQDHRFGVIRHCSVANSWKSARSPAGDLPRKSGTLTKCYLQFCIVAKQSGMGNSCSIFSCLNVT